MLRTFEIVHENLDGGRVFQLFCSAIVKCGHNCQHKEMLPNLKGQCHEIFCLWFFASISFPPDPEYPIWTVSNFFENSRRYSQIKVDHRCQRHRWQMKKIFNQKNVNKFVGTPLDSRGYTYIHFCLQVHFKVSAA